MGILALLFQFAYLLLIARVIISWVPQLQKNRIAHIIYDLTEPVLRPIRQILPPVGGLDLSVLVVFIALNFLSRILL